MTASLLGVVGVFFLMLLGAEAGYRAGRRAQEKDPEGAHSGAGVVEAAVFGLLGLLLGFAFGGAISRFEARRALIVTEANAIGTAWLRLDLLPSEEQPAIRELFRRYLEARLSVYEKLPDEAAAREELGRAVRLQDEIWTSAREASPREPGSPAAILLLPALNEMFDVATSRTRAAYAHVPGAIIGLLFTVAVLGAILAGHAMAGGRERKLLHTFLFAGAVSVTLFVILDIEFPRLGFIRLDRADRVLYELRDSLK